MKKASTIEEGFTIIELVVILVIISILSAIAIGNYFKILNLARENKTLMDVNSYMRMIAFCQASGKITNLPKNAGELSQCTPVPACQWAAHLRGSNACSSAGTLQLGKDNPATSQWNSPDGYYNIRLDIDQNRLNIRAIPYFHDYAGITGCFNPSGTTKLETFEVDKSNYDGGKRMRGMKDTTDDVPLISC